MLKDSNIKDPVKRIYAAIIKNLDDQVGRLLQHIDSLGLDDNTNQLYNLKTDSIEMNNLYDARPEVAKELIQDLDGWEKEMIKPLWPRVVNYVYRDGKGKYVFAF